MIGLSHTRAQNVIAAENVKRQVTVAVLVALKEAPFLSAVQGHVCCVHVQNDPGRSLFNVE